MAKQIRDTIISGQNTMRTYSLDGVMSPASGVIEHIVYEFDYTFAELQSNGANAIVSENLQNTFPVKIITVQFQGNGETTVVDIDQMPITDTINTNTVVHPNVVLDVDAVIKLGLSADTKVRIVCQRVAIV